MEDTDIHRDVNEEFEDMLGKSWRHRWKKRQISVGKKIQVCIIK
jgi:hypothetical protein